MAQKVNIQKVTFLVLVSYMISGCDESGPLNHSTRAEAEAENLFAQGWLPEIIPPSSRNISIHNDLDLNISNGEFCFEPSEHGIFVGQLMRVPSRDEGGSLAYVYRDCINGEENHGWFAMKLTQDKHPSEL